MNEIKQKPRTGTMWRHYNGNYYDVLALANECSDRPEYPPTVVYQGDNGKIWSRRLSDWDRSFTFVGLCPMWPHS